MADVRHQRKEGSAVSDRMRYVSKPIAVRSENLVTSVKASNGSLFNGDGSTQVIFDIPAMSGGYYLDTAATRFSFNVQLQTIGASSSTSLDANSYLFLDRGPQSIINRFQLYDASGHLLEDIQNYHILYGLVKVCTGNRAVTESGTIYSRNVRIVMDTTKPPLMRLKRELLPQQHQEMWTLHSEVQFIRNLLQVLERCTIMFRMRLKERWQITQPHIFL